ncbi:ABC transporter permease [Labrys wisconsinensis]|uniref:Ribose transport system permease protein n=1 Tax=Labrys wisconsinensis TaxID=425677 RepID=A0ABU0JIB6_9HYPH|nr:ABC transporter permease [Labrys wisconsinensis]MDQ0474022.1 ribose transport system permease protein [Labrys wisconsinensis]
MSVATPDHQTRAPGGPPAGQARAAFDRLAGIPMLPVAVLVFAAFALTVPGFGTVVNLDTMARVLAPLLVAAIGATLIMLAGGIDLSVGATMSLASVLGAMAMKESGSVALGCAAGAAVGAAVGVVNAVAIVRLRLTPFVHTLAVMLTARALAFLASHGASVGGLPPAATAFGRLRLAGVPVLLLIAAALFLVALLVLHRSVFGRWIYLVGANERAALFNAVPVDRVKAALYVLGGTAAGIAAMLAVLRLGSGSPVLGDNILLQVIAAVVVGGTSVFGGEGGLVRTLTGVALIVMLDKGLDIIGLAFYDQAIIIGLVILAGSALGTALQRRKTLRG